MIKVQNSYAQPPRHPASTGEAAFVHRLWLAHNHRIPRTTGSGMTIWYTAFTLYRFFEKFYGEQNCSHVPSQKLRFRNEVPVEQRWVLVFPLHLLPSECKWYGYFPTVFEFDPVWKSFYPSVSDSKYSISVTDPYPNTQKLHFMMSTSIAILFGKN